MDSCV